MRSIKNIFEGFYKNIRSNYIQLQNIIKKFSEKDSPLRDSIGELPYKFEVLMTVEDVNGDLSIVYTFNSTGKDFKRKELYKVAIPMSQDNFIEALESINIKPEDIKKCSASMVLDTSNLYAFIYFDKINSKEKNTIVIQLDIDVRNFRKSNVEVDNVRPSMRPYCLAVKNGVSGVAELLYSTKELDIKKL